MTQKQELLSILSQLCKTPLLEILKPGSEKMAQFTDIIARAQNSKEYGGEADGSISVAEWNKAMDINLLLEKLSSVLYTPADEYIKQVRLRELWE